ncbi:MAG: glucose-6-phosphate isomerase [Deltaproteobacteria bacterium]|nr:glucose-6-phosphate isomerase [Deltaproteobacteria bacterium]
MEGLNLNGFTENKTIANQVKRGLYIQNPFNSVSFLKANRISLDISYIFDTPVKPSISRENIESLIPDILNAHRALLNNEGDVMDGNTPMTGWQDLPIEIADTHIDEIKSAARNLSEDIDAFVSIGIGGSYLGIEATFRALTHNYFNQLCREKRGNAPEIYFLGHNMDPDYFRDTLDMLEGKRIGINVISKSGTTTETAIAFRILQQLMEKNWGKQSKKLIIATTDKSRGALRSLAEKRGYRSFVIPDNIGGRFSVLTDVGLFGLAMAKIDIKEFVEGFRRMREITMSDEFWRNPALVHAAARHAAWLNNKKVEVVACNSSSIFYVARWMEQLFPESEGHKGHGLWVSPSLYSEKLHANGQMVQEGERNILETFLLLGDHDNRIDVPADEDNLDGLNFLCQKGMDMNSINRKVIEGPAYAHYQGGVPNMTIKIPKRNAFNLGQLYYMLEKSVAISGYLLGHNPFIQPGVEAYKKAMFSMVEKPGYEDISKEMAQNMAKIERIIINGS